MNRSKNVEIKVEQMTGGWSVVVYIDGAETERSPAVAEHDVAMGAAKSVAKMFELKMPGGWRKV